MNNLIQNSKVLVTGGAGFIGSNLCEALLGSGNEVICLDNFATGKFATIQPFLSLPNFRLIEGDIRNYEDCQIAVRGCRYVLHHAALGSVPRSIKDPGASTDVNIGGFVKMLQASVEAGVQRFIYAASSSTYGDHTSLPKQEHVIGKALSPYAITKYVDELFAENFSKMYGIETVGLRYFNVFGPRQDPSGAYAAVIPRFVIRMLNHRAPIINGDGSQSRDFTYIGNVISANHLAAITPAETISMRRESYYQELGIKVPGMSSDAALSEVINVACGENTSLLELVGLLRQYLQTYDPDIACIEPEFGPGRVGDVPHSLASIEKARQLFNYIPKFNFKQGLQLATSWYHSNYRLD